jgi:predicted AAA+ superfamily ATPase
MVGRVIRRDEHLRQIARLLAQFPVVGILGARQVGKTTLARDFIEHRASRATCFDLEDPRDLGRLGEPMLALGRLRGLVVLDEIQRRPDLFPVLRVLADRPRTRARFLVLGSASPELLRQSTETLAGRITFHELSGFDLIEVGTKSLDRLWLRGGFPRSFLAKTEARSAAWRRELIRSFLERDLPQLGIRIPAATMRRFWSMLAHHHAQLWNSSEYARALGVADHTVRRYLDLLSATFAVRQLQPWHENLGKRQVKAPRIYVRDSGLLHALLGLQTMADLEGHPKIGASWEGFALENVIRHLGARAEESYFWRTHAGAELDLLIVRGRKRLGFEFKLTDAPAVTPSMRSALLDLRLDRLDVVHAGEETFPLAKTVRAVSLRAMMADLRPLPGG